LESNKLSIFHRVVIKDGHGDKDILYECDRWTDVSYRTDMADIFFEYS
jgi:hypothetical protein